MVKTCPNCPNSQKKKGVISFHSSFLDCQYLQVDLKNDVLSKQNLGQGTYEGYQVINGRRSWKKASQAIWFVPQFNYWAIGNFDDIGTTKCGIASKRDYNKIDDPSNEWEYWNNEDVKWTAIPIGDIIMNCKGKYF